MAVAARPAGRGQASRFSEILALCPAGNCADRIGSGFGRSAAPAADGAAGRTHRPAGPDRAAPLAAGACRDQAGQLGWHAGRPHDAGHARHFDIAADAAMDLHDAAALAARRGVGQAAFDALPHAAKFAWGWLAFNEPAVESLSNLPNARVILYEELCRHPLAVSRALFAFAGLDWHRCTDAFLGLSTSHQRHAGYFDVFRTTEDTAERWRQLMSPQDQESVRAVVCTSPLARCWPDLTAPPG
jgi:hypothetical protein